MLGMKGRGEKRKTRNVIPMAVGKKDRRLVDALAAIPMAEIADAGAGVKNNLLAAGIYFEAARIAAKGNMIRRRTGDAAAHTSEFDLKTHSSRTSRRNAANPALYNPRHASFRKSSWQGYRQKDQ